MLGSTIIAFVGYALALLFTALFVSGLGGVALVVFEPRGHFAQVNGPMTRTMLFVCGPLAIAVAVITRALV